MSDYFIEKPEHIKVSVTNICSYKCVMCFNPTLKEEHTRKNSNVPFCVKCTDLYTTRRAELSVRGAADVLVRISRRVAGAVISDDPSQAV